MVIKHEDIRSEESNVGTINFALTKSLSTCTLQYQSHQNSKYFLCFRKFRSSANNYQIIMYFEFNLLPLGADERVVAARPGPSGPSSAHDGGAEL